MRSKIYIPIPLVILDDNDKRLLPKEAHLEKIRGYIGKNIAKKELFFSVDELAVKEVNRIARNRAWAIAEVEVLNPNHLNENSDMFNLEIRPLKCQEYVNHDKIIHANDFNVELYNATWLVYGPKTHPSHTNKLDLFTRSAAKFPHPSILMDAITALKDSFDKKDDTYDAVGQKTLMLSRTLVQGTTAGKLAAIDQFQKESLDLINPAYIKVSKAIAVLAITALIAVAVAAIGFGIGFACGLWTGPGAFVTGLLTASAAAISVVTVGGAAGLAAGAVSVYGLFGSSKQEEAINEFCDNTRYEASRI